MKQPVLQEYKVQTGNEFGILWWGYLAFALIQRLHEQDSVSTGVSHSSRKRMNSLAPNFSALMVYRVYLLSQTARILSAVGTSWRGFNSPVLP